MKLCIYRLIFHLAPGFDHPPQCYRARYTATCRYPFMWTVNMEISKHFSQSCSLSWSQIEMYESFGLFCRIHRTQMTLQKHYSGRIMSKLSVSRSTINRGSDSSPTATDQFGVARPLMDRDSLLKLTHLAKPWKELLKYLYLICHIDHKNAICSW